MIYLESMYQMRTTWNYSKETEAIRIIATARLIKKGFYLEKGFYILPRLAKGNSKTIYFPKLNYHAIPDFWKRVNDFSETSEYADKNLVDQVAAITPFARRDFSQLTKDWHQIQRFFFNYLENNYQLPKKINSIEIRPTLFGSIATGYSYFSPDDSMVIVYVRIDGGVLNIVKGILLHVLKKLIDHEDPRQTWEEEMAVIDDFIKRLSNKFPHMKFIPILKDFRAKEQGNLASVSKKYLGSFGIQTQTRFTVLDGAIYLNKKRLTIKLTPNEKSILLLLISSRNRTVTYDAIASQLWGDESYVKFSLYSINKLIQRLRTKLNTIAPIAELIQAVRKEGYILVD